MMRHKESCAWFEELYKNNYNQSEKIPWASMRANAHLIEYLQKNPACEKGHKPKAIVIGCGLGDDAKAIADAGYATTAIDISESAIAWCKERFIGEDVEFLVHDVFELPSEMIGAYDFVYEALTIQSLPLQFREAIIRAITSLLAPEAEMLVIAHVKDESSKRAGPPWPLVQEELEYFIHAGLSLDALEVIQEPSHISDQKFKALFRR